jgi:hypothetical protein
MWMRFLTGASHREVLELTEEITSADMAKVTVCLVTAVSLLYFGIVLAFSW